MFNRNIVLILIAMPLSMTSAPVLVLIGGLLGERLAPSSEYATMPIAFLVIGTALGAIPAASIMKKAGRRKGFLLAQLLASTAAILGLIAISVTSFLLLLLSALQFGFSVSFVQQARFAVIENAKNPAHMPRILSFLMLTGVGAGFLGPELAYLSKDFLGESFMGSFLVIALLQCLAFCILWHYQDLPAPAESPSTEPRRPIAVLLKSPPIVLAVIAGAVGYGVMSFIMTATPNSMHHLHGHDLASTKWVIQSHIAAMFLPSLFSGLLISRIGTKAVIVVGASLYAISIALGLSGTDLPHFFLTLVLLGLGWNFLFMSSTMLLAQSYREEEKFSAQAANDFVIFTVQALASLSAGWVLYQVGWTWVLWLSLPILGLLVIFLLWNSWRTRAVVA